MQTVRITESSRYLNKKKESTVPFTGTNSSDDLCNFSVYSLYTYKNPRNYIQNKP